MSQRQSHKHLHKSIVSYIDCIITTNADKRSGSLTYDKKNDIMVFYGVSEQDILKQLQELYPCCISIIIPCDGSYIALNDEGNIKCIIGFKNGKCSLKEGDDLLNVIASIERIRIWIKYDVSLPKEYFILLIKNGQHTLNQIASLNKNDLNKMGITTNRNWNKILKFAECIPTH